LFGIPVDAAALAGVGSSARLSVGDEAWTWAERISSIITIAGLVVLFLQLRQLTRRTKVRVGFHQDPGGTGTRLLKTVRTIDLPVRWNPEDDLSQPIRLAVVVVNEASASATAQDVNFEVRYPKWLVPDGMGELKEPPGMDVWSFSKERLTLNPGLAEWLRATFRVPRGHQRIQLLAIASMRDSKFVHQLLTISLKES